MTYKYRLSKNEDDGLIVRESTTKDRLTLKKYSISVLTGNVRGAGTDANVFINLFGTKVRQKVNPHPTVVILFSRGKADLKS